MQAVKTRECDWKWLSPRRAEGRVGQPSRLPLVHQPSRLVFLEPGRPKDRRQAGRLPHFHFRQAGLVIGQLAATSAL